MNAAWNVLSEAGVPIGAVHSSHRLADAATLRGALDQAMADPALAGRPSDALRAWLDGFRHHWPTAYDELLGAAGARARAALGEPSDPGRHLKLRRIAIARLAELV